MNQDQLVIKVHATLLMTHMELCWSKGTSKTCGIVASGELVWGTLQAHSKKSLLRRKIGLYSKTTKQTMYFYFFHLKMKDINRHFDKCFKDKQLCINQCAKR